MSTTKKVIAIVGATGTQGGGLIKELLKHGGWTIRAVTRNPYSDAAKQLKSQGVEVIVGDVNNKEDITKAFKGADAVFANLVSDYTEGGFEKEIKQGKMLVDVANEQKINHFIWSSEENAEVISKGTHKVPSFTSKARIQEYMFQSGLPSTAVQMSAFYENWTTGRTTPRLNAEGVYELAGCIPGDTKFVRAAAEELGQVVEKILERREEYLGKKVVVTGDYLSNNEVVAIFSKIWKKTVTYKYIPPEVFAKFPFPHADKIAEMFDWMHQYGYLGEKVTGRDVWESKKLCTLSTAEQWIEKNFPSPPPPANTTTPAHH